MSGKKYFTFFAMIKFYHDGKVRRIHIVATDLKDAKRQASEFHGDVLSVERAS